MGSDVAAIFDLGWKLLLVLGLAVLAMRALRWISNPVLHPNGPMTIVARLPIGPQQAVIVIAVGDKRLLIGQSPNQISLLSELRAEDTDLDRRPADQVPTARGSLRIGSLTIRPDMFQQLGERLTDLVGRRPRSTTFFGQDMSVRDGASDSTERGSFVNRRLEN